MPSKTKKSGPAVTSKHESASKAEQQQVVDWPLFQPLIPVQDLSLTHLKQDQICTISNLWTPTLCKKYTSFLASLPLITTPGQPKKGHAVRVNDRFQIDDTGFAERLWHDTGLKQLLTGPESQMSDSEQAQLWGGTVLGLNPNIRVYRYTKGQFFAQHYDDYNNVMLGGGSGDGEAPRRARTTWTLLLYLTSPATGCSGGETVFYPDNAPSGKKGAAKFKPEEPVVVGLETGMALLHKHGKDCMLHEGREVTAGEKWVIRSDLCVAMF